MSEDVVYYVLVCRDCSEVTSGEPRHEPIPFPSAEERGRWAAEHEAGTGHSRWWVRDVRA